MSVFDDIARHIQNLYDAHNGLVKDLVSKLTDDRKFVINELQRHEAMMAEIVKKLKTLEDSVVELQILGDQDDGKTPGH